MDASGFSYNTAALPQLVDVVERMFVGYQENYPRIMYEQEFITKDAKAKGDGMASIYAENIITDQYAAANTEGAPAEIYPAQYGYEKAAYINYFKKAISITKVMRVAGKGNQVEREIKNLIEGPTARLELDLANRFGYAATLTSYVNKEGVTVDTTCGDTKALLATDHALSGSATTFTNIVTGNPAFSKSALELAMQIAARNSFDNLGKNIEFRASHVLTSNDPVTCNQVRELLFATSNVESSNAGTYNVYSSANAGLKHVPVARLALDQNGTRSTSLEKYWYVIDAKQTSVFCSILEAPYVNTPMTNTSGQDFLTENWNFLSGMAYGIAIVSPKGIVGSK